MNKSKYLIISLISISLISLELVWTRIFSAEFFYTFAFLILSFAILGIGLGGLALRLFPKIFKYDLIGYFLALSALFSIIDPALVIALRLDFSLLYSDFYMIAKFLLTIILLGLPFFFGGVGLTMLLKSYHSDMPKLYMADMAGAGLGVLLSVIVMNLIGTPTTVFFCSIPILISAFIIFKRFSKAIPVVLLVLAFVLSLYSEPLLEMPRKEKGTTVHTHWDAMSKVKIIDYNEVSRGIRIDNAANTSVYKFNGDWNRADFTFQIDVSNLIQRFPDCRFLSLGAGGGVDVLLAIKAGAKEVHAVEVNPYINYMMLDGFLAEYSGNIYKDPRVTVATEDARAYVQRFENKFDVIYSLSSNSFAALASGAFALAENYLFTTEAIQDYWRSLSNNGFMMIEHHFYIPRVVSETMDALTDLGINDPQKYFAVYNLPNLKRNIILISKQPLTDEIINTAFGATTPALEEYYYLLYPAADSNRTNVVNQIVTKGWEQAQESSKVDISPCTDNRPFIAQMGLWSNFDLSKLGKVMPFEYFGFPLSKLNILIILALVLLIIIPLNLIPYIRKEKSLRLYPWLYFFAIGAGFMFIEVILIQKYTLFIGPSVYGLVTILLTLLVASGAGSRYSNKFNNKIVFGSIILWLLLDIFVFRHLFHLLGGLPLFPRMMISAILIAPLGFFMGMPFPKAGQKVGELIDWGFAVNGAASVLGSTLIILVAFTWGYNLSLALGGLMYLIAYYLINKEANWN